MNFDFFFVKLRVDFCWVVSHKYDLCILQSRGFYIAAVRKLCNNFVLLQFMNTANFYVVFPQKPGVFCWCSFRCVNNLHSSGQRCSASGTCAYCYSSFRCVVVVYFYRQATEQGTYVSIIASKRALKMELKKYRSDSF